MFFILNLGTFFHQKQSKGFWCFTILVQRLVTISEALEGKCEHKHILNISVGIIVLLTGTTHHQARVSPCKGQLASPSYGDDLHTQTGTFHSLYMIHKQDQAGV